MQISDKHMAQGGRDQCAFQLMKHKLELLDTENIVHKVSTLKMGQLKEFTVI